MFTTLFDLIFPPRNEELLVRKATLEDIEILLNPQIENGIISLLPFKDPLVAACIHECKYFKNKKAIMLLSHALSLFLTDWFLEHHELESQVVLTYIPLSTKRYKNRGYNQVEEVLNKSGWKYESVLEKVRDTISQTKLSRDKRLKNQEHVFRSRANPHTTYIIVDDVATTGATLISAGEELGGSALLLAISH